MKWKLEIKQKLIETEINKSKTIIKINENEEKMKVRRKVKEEGNENEEKQKSRRIKIATN